MPRLGITLWIAVAVLMAPALIAAVAHDEPRAETIPPLMVVREAADPTEGADSAVWFAQAAYSDQQAREHAEALARAQRASRSARRQTSGCHVANDTARLVIAGREGIGHINSEHPGPSSASGKYGFTDGTWNDYAGVHEAWMASEADQDRKFDETWQDGAGVAHWAASGGCPRSG